MIERAHLSTRYRTSSADRARDEVARFRKKDVGVWRSFVTKDSQENIHKGKHTKSLRLGTRLDNRIVLFSLF